MFSKIDAIKTIEAVCWVITGAQIAWLVLSWFPQLGDYPLVLLGIYLCLQVIEFLLKRKRKNRVKLSIEIRTRQGEKIDTVELREMIEDALQALRSAERGRG